MKRVMLMMLLAAVGASLAACGSAGAGTGGAASGAYDTEFPLPSSVSNFTKTGEDEVNFQTKMSLEETTAFYRESLTKAGLVERTINTAVTAQTFSMVFDGAPNGKAIVVQGVALGDGTTNVNIRYEDV